MTTLNVKLTFNEFILGTSPSNPDLFLDYVASKAPDASTVEDEVASLGVAEYADKSMTVFPRTKDGQPFLYDYQIKGFFKDAAGMLRKIPGTESSKIKAYKKEIDGLIFPQPREIIFEDYGTIAVEQRSLRASTPQGERTALAISEKIEAGASVTFSIVILKDDLVPVVREWLDYGILRGIGQWRNSGAGRFTCEIL